MNVGFINNANYAGAGFSTVRPSANLTPNTVRNNPLAPDAKEEPGAGGIAVRYFGFDGDSVEISGNAIDLWRKLASENEAPMTQPDISIKVPDMFYLPSLFAGRAEFQNNPDINSAFRDRTMTGITPLNAAQPNSGLPNSKLPDANTGSFEINPLKPPGECKTCESRRYVDKSDDSSVSFQTPTKINPNMAAAAVASHESEHVRNEQSKAQRDGRQIINQSVTLLYDICPECGRSYVAGGVTRTTSINGPESDESDGFGDSDDTDSLL